MKEATERECDNFLRSCGALGHDGIYAEAYLTRKARRHESGGEYDLESIPDDTSLPDTLIVSEFLSLGVQARLTVRQQAAFALRLDGYTQREIGRLLGITHQAVCSRLRAACVKLLACPDMMETFDLHECYQQMVHSVVCRRRKSPRF